MPRLIAAVLIGFVSWLAIGVTGFVVLRSTWPAYALAEPHKAYTLAMLLARLTVGVVCSLAAGWVSTIVANRDTRAAWWVGGLALVVSAYVHLVDVWADYPAWYHFAYLLPLMPLIGGGGRLAGRRSPA